MGLCFSAAPKYWLNKFRGEDGAAQGFIRLDEMPAHEICLRYPNGVELLMPANTSMSTLGELIKLAHRLKRQLIKP